MGYSTAKKAIRKVVEYLDKMLEAETDVSFPAEDSLKLVYAIRTGIKAATAQAVESAQNNEDIEPYLSYSKLGSKFIIRAKPGEVMCELRDAPIVSRLRNTLNAMSIPGVKDMLGIIGATIKHQSAKQLIFPDANGNTINSDKLLTWAKSKDFSVTITDAHVTLTRNAETD